MSFLSLPAAHYDFNTEKLHGVEFEMIFFSCAGKQLVYFVWFLINTIIIFKKNIIVVLFPGKIS